MNHCEQALYFASLLAQGKGSSDTRADQENFIRTLGNIKETSVIFHFTLLEDLLFVWVLEKGWKKL